MRIPQLLLAVVFTSASVFAQDAAPPAHVSFVEGSAVVYHAVDRVPPPAPGQSDSEPAVLNMPIVQGDRVRTLARSRVEVMFPDGAGIAIESDSEVEFVTSLRVRVIAGAIEHLPAARVDPRSPSTQNLPPDLQGYGPQFDQNGTWQYEPQYGNVWYPAAVAADWRPYSDGYWSSYPAYGWTWIGYEPWAWPTHHYGRWGYARSRWFWIPGRSYASAWVSWGTAPGYISWCPLGYDNRAVVGFSAGIHSSWNAWTVVPRDRFGARGYSARRYAVEPNRIGSSVAFIEHRTAPAFDRRGSFSVAGQNPAVRPLTDVRAPSTDFSRGAYPESDQNGSAYDRRDQSRSRADGRRIVSGDERSSNTEPRGNPGDHPAYRPQYQPRYDPTYEAPGPPQAAVGRPQSAGRSPQSAVGSPRSTVGSPQSAVGSPRSTGGSPRSAGGSPPSAVNRPPSAVSRPQSTIRSGPSPVPSTPAPRRMESPPARQSERQNSAPAREPHSSARSRESSSQGTAVRRPR